MEPRYLHHITLTTGHARRSYRREVSAQAVAVCADLVKKVATGADHVLIPGVYGYYLSGRSSGRCLVATVWSLQSSPSLTDPSSGQAPICTIGVAAHSRCGDKLWREMHRWGELPVVTDPERCPPEPWVAAALDAGALAHPDAAHWLGDFERCLGWAWIDT